MSKLLTTCAALAVTAMFALPAPANAAQNKAGISQTAPTDISAARRFHHYGHHYYGRRVYGRSYYAPYRAYAYDPYYRPYRPYYYRPGVSVGVGPFGFGFGF